MCYVCAWSFPMYSTYNKLVVKGKTSFNISTFIHSNDMMQTCYRINSRFRNLVPKKPTVLLLECFACTHESSEETFSCLMNCFVHIILHTYTSFRIFFRFNEPFLNASPALTPSATLAQRTNELKWRFTMSS